MRSLLVALLALTASAARAADAPLVPDGATLEKLWSDGTFTEGPALGPDGCIYFGDIGNRILKFDPEQKLTSTFRDPSGRSNGLKFDAKGRLIACEGANTGGNRRISVTESGKVRSLAADYQGKKFNSPNDLTLDAAGRVYFTDPRYVGGEPLELDHQSVYRIDVDGTVTRVIADATKPNGLVITPDQKTLYLANNDNDPKGKRLLLAYPLNKDGSVGARRQVFDFGDDRGIDGMTIDTEGRVWAAAGRKNTAGVTVFSPEGKKLAFVPTPEDPTNVCFGGKDLSVLYITAGKSLYRVPTNVKGYSPIASAN